MTTERVIWELAEQQHGLVGRRQLNEIGIGNQALRPSLRRGALIPITDQVLRVAGADRDVKQEAMAAVMDAPLGAVLSHRSAAALWALPGFRLQRPYHVTVPRQGLTHRSSLSVVHFHKDLPATETVLVDDIPVTTPALTIFHLAGMLHPAQTERALDNALARRLLSPKKFLALTIRLAARGRNGSRVARQLANARAESYRPPESGFERRVQWCSDRAGVEVERQVDLGDDEFIGRADFRLIDCPGVIEAQSALHHSTPLDRSSDEVRARRYLEAGISVLFVWDHQVFQKGEIVVREIRRFRDDASTTTQPFFRQCPDE